VRLWDLHTNETLILPGDQAVVRGLQVLPDGHLASGGGDGTVGVWELDTNEALILPGHHYGVHALAVRTDGRLASGGGDGTVRLWDRHTNEALTLPGHQDVVLALTGLPDGRLASGDGDGTVRVWDRHMNEALVLPGHQDGVSALAVLMDGRLASGGVDGSVRVWDLAAATSRIVGHHGPELRVTDAVDVRLVCQGRRESRPFGWDRSGSLVLVREADGTRTVGIQESLHGMGYMLSHMLSRAQTASCRAFLIEPEVLARLQEVVQQTFEVGSDKALGHAFAAETIASNMDIARLLSAIPDLDGEARGWGLQFRRLPGADGLDAFPARLGPLTVVLVFDE
jgi:hypothetical protein